LWWYKTRVAPAIHVLATLVHPCTARNDAE
jgi:hypothetical protein